MPLKTWNKREQDGPMTVFTFGCHSTVIISKAPWTVSFGSGSIRAYGQSPVLHFAIQKLRTRIAQMVGGSYAGVARWRD